MPIEIFLTKLLKLVVVHSFCFGLNISPPLALIAKNGDIWEPFYFLPIGTSKKSEDYTIVERGAIGVSTPGGRWTDE
jgi:hypothetical protein